MFERAKTLLLLLLVLGSVTQFAFLVLSAHEPLYTLPPREIRTASELPLQAPELLAAPVRMIANFTTPGRHALLRSNSGYFHNIWVFAKSALTAGGPFLSSQIVPVSAQLWNPALPSLELILNHPLPLWIYLDLLGIPVVIDEENGEAHFRSLVVDRFYLPAAAEGDSRVLFSDGLGGIYALPRGVRRDVLQAFLEISEEGVATIQPVDLASFGLEAAHVIYNPGAAQVSSWAVSPVFTPESFALRAPGAFRDLALMRHFEDELEAVIFEDGERRLSLSSGLLLLEQARGGLHQGGTYRSLWQEAAGFLRRSGLMPEDNYSFFFDGFSSIANREVVFFQQAHWGRPVFIREDGVSGYRMVSTLRASGRNSELVTLRYRPLRFTNIIRTVTAYPLEQLLARLATIAPELPGLAGTLPLVRDIYEGFLFAPSGELVSQPVWVIEFVHGYRYFFDMITGTFQGYLPPVGER